jgi:2',3'-cyclic-nucleotide 2'-phosphodiesterase/3'-nucleotidase
MAGTSGSHLGIIDIELVSSGNDRWQPAEFTSSLRPIAQRKTSGAAEAEVPEDPDLVRLLAPSHARTRALMDAPVGHVDEALHSYFSFFGPDRGLALVAAAQAAALRPHLADGPASGLPLLSAASPGKFGARAGPDFYTNVPAGSVSLRNVADLHVFPNHIAAVVVTGDQLLDWIEMSASLFRQIIPEGTDQTLVDPDMPGHDFDVLHGITYQIDLSVPARYFPDGTRRDQGNHRLRNATHNGVPIRADDRFAVALNSYRANGGGPFVAVAQAEKLKVPSLSVRDAIRRYVSDPPPDDPLRAASPPWSFVPMAGTSVIAHTGPGALRHEAEMARLGISVTGVTSDGFLRLRIPV